jgi:hypothetical protein
MKAMAKQNIRGILQELLEDEVYLANTTSATNEQFHHFRLDVERLCIRCLEVRPEEAGAEEIRERLERLGAQCVGGLTSVRSFVDRGLVELGEGSR